MKQLLIVSTLISLLFAGDFYQNIKTKQQSYAKDLFLWQAMLYDSLDDDEKFEAFLLTKQPKQEQLKALNFKNTKSINAKISFNEWQTFKGNKNKYIDELAYISPKKATMLYLFETKEPIDNIDADVYANLFLWISDPKTRNEKLNFKPKSEICSNLQITKIIKRAIYSNNQNTIKTLQECKNIDSDGLFYLGINEFMQNNQKNATDFFAKALQNANQEEKEKINYWLYKTTKNKTYLKNAAKDSDYFYGTLAKVELGELPNRFELFTFSKQNDKLDINLSSPFEEKTTSKYLKSLTKTKLNKLKEQSMQKDYEPLFARINQIEGKKVFIAPYLDLMQNEGNENKALWLAIARQESQFFPNDVSPAYAIGVMQIIPALSSDLNPKIKPLELLEPNINVPLAISYFKKLKQNYKSPAFVAISFNAGQGYLKRLQAKNLFDMDDKLLALELIDYDETRQYVKRVLYNYIVYCNALGVQINEKTILQNPFAQFHTLH